MAGMLQLLKEVGARFFRAKKRIDIAVVDDEDEEEQEQQEQEEQEEQEEEEEDEEAEESDYNTVIKESSALLSFLSPEVGRKGDDTVHDVD